MKLDINRLHQEVQSLSGARCTPVQIEKLLAILTEEGNFWQLSGKAHLPVPVVSATIKLLIENQLAYIENGMVKPSKGLKEWVKEQGYGTEGGHLCPRCEGRGMVSDRLPAMVREYFLEAVKERGEPLQQFDQASVTPETTLVRVAFMDWWGDLRGRRILVMGAEDDLTGLAIALTRLAEYVLIVDIDERLIELDNRWFKKLGIDNAEARVFDLRNPFPQEWLHSFDVFITDPPETLAAFCAFIGRGIAALRGMGSAGYFGLTMQDSSVFRWRELQQLLVNEWGAAITAIVPDFNWYMPWKYHQHTRAATLTPQGIDVRVKEVWYRSSWFRIEVLEEGAGSNEPISSGVLSELYVDAESSTT